MPPELTVSVSAVVTAPAVTAAPVSVAWLAAWVSVVAHATVAGFTALIAHAVPSQTDTLNAAIVKGASLSATVNRSG